MKQNTVVFTINHERSQASHFIFGTMHLANDDAFTHVQQAQILLENCTHYYGEMDLGKISPDALENAFKLPFEGKLVDLMSKKQYKRMENMLRKAFQFEIQAHENYIPFYIQSMLTENVLEKKHGLPLDYFLYQEALNAGKELGGIESPERQLDILKQIPLTTQLKGLRKITRDPKKFRKTLKRLSCAYQKADIKKIYQMSKKQLGGMRKLLLIERNEKMAEFIFQHLGNTSSFFSLGAGHLDGQKGVLELLKTKGCIIEPVY